MCYVACKYKCFNVVERNVRQHNTCVMQPRNLIHVPRNITHPLPGTTVSITLISINIELAPNVTRRVLLSSSTLFNIWEDPNLKVENHFEMEAVVGGRVRDLTRVLDRMYLCDKPNRLEVILVCSINNIGDGQAPEDIIEEMQEMKELVEDHSKLQTRSSQHCEHCYLHPAPQVLLVLPATQCHRPGGLDPTQHLQEQSRADRHPEQEDQGAERGGWPGLPSPSHVWYEVL